MYRIVCTLYGYYKIRYEARVRCFYPFVPPLVAQEANTILHLIGIEMRATERPKADWRSPYRVGRQLGRKRRGHRAIHPLRRTRSEHCRRMMSQHDDTSMGLLGSYRRAFICKPIKICFVCVVVVFDGPLLDLAEVIQTLADYV